MANTFCINKSGRNIPVYSDTNKTKQIGSIYNREAFGYNRNWGGDNYYCNIVFLNSAGSLSYGFIIDPPDNSTVNCTEYPYGTVTINNTKYKTFKMRKLRNVYTAAGTKWGAVAANCRVACNNNISGNSHPDWKCIDYVESSKGGWVKVTGDGANYGFVDTGLSVASGYNSIPMYGSW